VIICSGIGQIISAVLGEIALSALIRARMPAIQPVARSDSIGRPSGSSQMARGLRLNLEERADDTWRRRGNAAWRGRPEARIRRLWQNAGASQPASVMKGNCCDS